MANKKQLKPINNILLVNEDKTDFLPPELINPKTIGEKAFGLSCLPQEWTLPFFVISDVFLSKYQFSAETERGIIIESWATKILSAALSLGFSYQTPIIIRSSGCSEGLKDRGNFYSKDGTLNNLFEPLKYCLDKFSLDKELIKHKIPLIVQKYAIPISLKGHLSNERRFYEEKRDWIGAYEEIESKLKKPFKINIRNWRKRITIEKYLDSDLECNLSAHVAEVLKIPATWGNELGLRLHFEWVWDGKKIYIVQADQENRTSGINPTTLYNSLINNSEGFSLKCLLEVNEKHAIKYNKIQNLFIYLKLGLPTTQLFILEDLSIIDSLAANKVPPILEEDLNKLIKRPLVIRTDIATNDILKRQLLPRTEVRTVDAALDWLKQQSAELKRRQIKEDPVFIFHNFIPAISSAFAYAAPGKRKVQIEALWGLPEGLYFNTHDKYVVDTLNPRVNEIKQEDLTKFEVQTKTLFKRFFVAPDITTGQWCTQVLEPPFDWLPSVQNINWVKEIALESRRIAEEEGKSLSIMWFVGVPPEVCPKLIFPWYHEPYDPSIKGRTASDRKKTPFDESLEIRKSSDIELLRQEVESGNTKVRCVKIQPNEEALLRDKYLLRDIGELTKKIGAVILMEGGILSHAYYQLIQTNAIVEVLHPFEDEDKREFNKLVRDKIPTKIERGGEIVRKKYLSGEALLRALLEKLIEESYEVLDATDQDSIIGELADVSEVIDGIINHLGVNREILQKRQEEKREKAGGFKEGLVLMETQNPLPIAKPDSKENFLINIEGDKNQELMDLKELFKLSHKIDKWNDRREHPAATEVVLRLLIPSTIDNWTASTPETIIDSDFSIQGKIKGARIGAKYQIELSIFSPQRQLKLF